MNEPFSKQSKSIYNSFRPDVELESEASKLSDQINIIKSDLDMVYQALKAKRSEVGFVKKEIAGIYEERKGEIPDVPSNENIDDIKTKYEAKIHKFETDADELTEKI